MFQVLPSLPVRFLTPKHPRTVLRVPTAQVEATANPTTATHPDREIAVATIPLVLRVDTVEVVTAAVAEMQQGQTATLCHTTKP